LGGIAALGNNPEDNTRVFLVAIVLTLGAKALDVVPVVGSDLSTIFAGLGTAAVGGALVVITLSVFDTLKVRLAS
jgi:hypothetical protein